MFQFYSILMNVLDEMWTNVMREAERQANGAQSGDVANYLRLREANDALRAKGIEWLFGIFQTVVAEANRRGLNIAVEKSDTHHFSAGSATMRGTLIRLRLGIRSLTVEAGFPRMPQDGFVRGGGLALARISHFGISKANQELMLAQVISKESPVWFSIDQNGARQPFEILRIKQHFATFLDIS